MENTAAIASYLAARDALPGSESSAISMSRRSAGLRGCHGAGDDRCSIGAHEHAAASVMLAPVASPHGDAMIGYGRV